MTDCCAASSPRNTTSTKLPSYAVRPGVTFPDWSVVTSPTVRDALLAIAPVFACWSGYDPGIDRVRVALLQLYLEGGRAPAASALAERTGLSRTAIRPLLEELRRRDLVVLDGARIIGAYPFADRDTGHRVTLDGRVLNAMCAVDALGIGVMTGRDIAITSRCLHCGLPIRITTQNQGRTLAKVEPSTAVVWQDVRYEGGCAANSLCATTVFFCSDDHLSAWRRERAADEAGFRLSMEEGLEAGRAVVGPSLAGLDKTPGSSAGATSEAIGVADHRYRTNGRNGDAYDLVVIGAGSAGFSASITAAGQGAQVALIGHGTIGGTCVNIGCVPSKTLIRAAETLHQAGAAGRFAGISAKAHADDWRALVRQKDELVAGLRQSKYSDLLPAYNTISYIEGQARLTEGGVALNGDLVKAERVIITTGARPAIPSIPGIEAVDYLTSTSALALETLPKSLLIIGGGFVGAELSQLFARMGVKVTIVCRSQLLPSAEPEVAEALAKYMRNEGIRLNCGVTYKLVKATNGEVSLVVKAGSREEILA